MDKKLIEKLSEKIYKKYPHVKGASPSVQEKLRKDGNDKTITTYLLTYQSKTVQENGRNFTQKIKVTVSEKGKILRISTSK
jgi:hypothetical protein